MEDAEARRLEALKLAAAHCNSRSDHDIVSHAEVFEKYLRGPKTRKPGRPAGSKNKRQK